MSNESIISVNSLSRSFGDLEAVKTVSFDVMKGEIFGFLGPNGAGKSTTITMLCTMLAPSGGTATINGFDITHEQVRVRENIGIIFQENTLDEDLTAEENLNLHCAFYRIPKEERTTRVQEVLRMVELDDKASIIVGTFSGGMKRRLEIARGLLHYPRVLFLDEPTVGLDPQTRAHIWDYIMKLKEREGITIFLTTHYMDEAEFCDRVAIMDHGIIIALDTPDRLKRTVGGDVIELIAEDNARAQEEIRSAYGLEAVASGKMLSITVERGNEFLVSFVRELSTPIRSINMRRPTLNDVFLGMTGREIRDMEQKVNGFKKARHGPMMRRR